MNVGEGSSSAATALANLPRALGAAARITGVLDHVPTDKSSTMPSNLRSCGRSLQRSDVEATPQKVLSPMTSLDEKYGFTCGGA